MIILDCDQDQFQDVRIWLLIRLLSFIPISAEVEFVKCFTQARFLNVPREGVKKGIFYGLAESTIFYTNAIRDIRDKFHVWETPSFGVGLEYMIVIILR